MCALTLGVVPTGTTIRGLTVIDDNVEALRNPLLAAWPDASECCKGSLRFACQLRQRARRRKDRRHAGVSPICRHHGAGRSAYAKRAVDSVQDGRRGRCCVHPHNATRPSLHRHRSLVNHVSVGRLVVLVVVLAVDGRARGA